MSYDRLDKKIYNKITSERPEYPEYRNRDKTARCEVKKSTVYAMTRVSLLLCNLGSYAALSAKQVYRNIRISFNKIKKSKKCVCYGRKHQDREFALRCPVCGSTEKQIAYWKRGLKKDN